MNLRRENMLPVYLDIEDEAKKIINKNIRCMLELLEETCKGLSYEEILDSIFPKHILDNDINKCIRSIAELDNMAGDKYEREHLAPFYEWVLYHVIAWWIDVTENGELYEIPREKAISKNGVDLFCTINNVDNYFDFMFEDWDFLDIEKFYTIYKRNPKMLQDVFHMDIAQYVELMPKDIQEEYKNLSCTRTKIEEEIEGQEAYIVKSIYTFLQLESIRAMKYEGCKEVDLSDIIRNGLFQVFQEHGLIIEREARGGYATKDLGELDFFIYSFKDGIYKQIAVGENKKWGEYKKSIGQLLGYMDSNTKFGFTIIYNTGTNLRTVLDGRKKILQEYNINGNFKVVGEIEEVDDMIDVLRTCHENPEKAGSYFYLYHFVFNICKPQRKKVARVNRTREKINGS